MLDLVTLLERPSPLGSNRHSRYDRKRKGRYERSGKTNPETREFVIWDGEGTATEPGTPQNYSLFGSFNGTEHSYIFGESLSTEECLEHIIDVGRANPDAIHVSFAFGYDVTMIVKDLGFLKLSRLKRTNRTQTDDYRIEHIPGKWFSVTSIAEKRTVKIFDIWGFFQSSFLAAIKANLVGHPAMKDIEQVEQGKKGRSAFTYKDIKFITSYWKVENVLGHALIVKLRELLYSVDLRITSWHGPGALANYTYTKRGIGNARGLHNDVVYDRSRYAYAGGRFERFLIGRFISPVYGYDINSAYPNAISQLPRLAGGSWHHVTRPTELAPFGMYRVRSKGPRDNRKASPLWHRDYTGNISFQWRCEGWYWTPEVEQALTCDNYVEPIEILEGWEFHPASDDKPFSFVVDMYNDRRDMKAKGIGAQMALKLCLNSLYGKMAQRAGWERTGEAPKWHELTWAGWVTSKTRAMLYEQMAKMDRRQLIAVETDGIYTTATPDQLGIVDSKELGGWEVKEYDELFYLQSGVYAARNGDERTLKYRGLDNGSLNYADFEKQARALAPATANWPTIDGTTTRFIGYPNALFRQSQNRGSYQTHLGVWETDEHRINCASAGKRVHSHHPTICVACREGKNAYDSPHDTTVAPIRGLLKAVEDGTATKYPMSHQHDIPWLKSKRAEWRDHVDASEGTYFDKDMFATAEAK